MTSLLILVLLLWSEPTPRCPLPTLPAALEDAKAVFVGKVEQVEDPGLPDPRLMRAVVDLHRPIKVRLKVEQVFRGEKLEEVEVTTKTGGFEWGTQFEVAKKYLVYAHQAGNQSGGLIVKGCGRTRLVKDAEEDLKFLNSLPMNVSPKLY